MRAKESLEKKPVILEPEAKKELAVVDEQPREASRSLAVIFMYNGHDWEAHDVLGVPQGSSMHQVTLAYQQLIKTADSRSLQFYELAYSAISTRHRKHRL